MYKYWIPINFFFFFGLFVFSRALPRHMEVPRPGVQVEAVADSLHHSHSNTDASRIWDLHPSSWQSRLLNPLREARDRAHNLMVPSRIRFYSATMRTPSLLQFLKKNILHPSVLVIPQVCTEGLPCAWYHARHCKDKEIRLESQRRYNIKGAFNHSFITWQAFIKKLPSYQSCAHGY